MKYTIENNGSGFCSIRVLCPESLAASFLAFIEQKSRENVRVIKSASPAKNETYFIELSSKTLLAFEQCLASGSSPKAAISAVNKKLKGLGFANTSYDIVKSILTRQGCFKTRPA